MQYRLLELFPGDSSSISYSAIKKLSENFTETDKDIKEAIIHLTASRYLKTSLKGFSITEEGATALQNYPTSALELPVVEPVAVDDFVVIGNDVQHEQANNVVEVVNHLPAAENEHLILTKFNRLKRNLKVERLVAMVVVAGAFAFGFYFGGTKPAGENRMLKKENQELQYRSKMLLEQRFNDSLLLDVMITDSLQNRN